MGFDLEGLKPKVGLKSENIKPNSALEEYYDFSNGRDFYANNNRWGYIWGLVEHYCCPDIVSEKDIENGHYNFGQYAISEEKAMKIAEKLEEARNAGEIETPVVEINEEVIQKLKTGCYKICYQCSGDGKEYFTEILPKQGEEIKIYEFECKICKGTGVVDKLTTANHNNIDPIKHFIQFCKNCGGFIIV